jgi:hypothetical protein
MTPRRLPATWTAEKIAGEYVVRDAFERALACPYCRATEARATQARAPAGREARLPPRRPRAAAVASATRHKGPPILATAVTNYQHASGCRNHQ